MANTALCIASYADALKKCTPMTLVSGIIRYMRIFVGVPLAGASNESGVVDNDIFWRFEWLLLRKLQR